MLTAKQSSIDLGDIKFGQVYKFSFTILNESNKPITVRKLAVACSSCTVATMKKKTIEPSETEQVNVTFTPGTISKQKKWIDVLYDNTSLRLKFQAQTHG